MRGFCSTESTESTRLDALLARVELPSAVQLSSARPASVLPYSGSRRLQAARLIGVGRDASIGKTPDT